MGFPKLETVKSFIQVCEKDGFESIVDKILDRELKAEYKPLFAYFKKIITDMLDDNMTEECNYYTSGFISCFDLFRRQIEADSMSLDDISLQLKNILAWSEFLERENLELKNEINELKRNDTGVRPV